MKAKRVPVRSPKAKGRYPTAPKSQPTERKAWAKKDDNAPSPRPERKTWDKKDDSSRPERKPWAKRDDDAASPRPERKAWAKRDDSAASPRPERKPWAKRDDSAASPRPERKPWAKRDDSAASPRPERKPWAKRDDSTASPRPERKPWAKRDDSAASPRPERKPWAKRDDSAASPRPERKPWAKRDDSAASPRPERKPWAKRDDSAASPRPERKPWAKRDDSAASPRPERKAWAKRDDNAPSPRPERNKREDSGESPRPERKAWARRQDTESNRDDDRKPTRSRSEERPDLKKRDESYPPLPAVVEDGLEVFNEAEDSPELVYGRQSVLAALAGERGINKVWVSERLRYDPRFLTLLEQAKSNGAVVDVTDIERLDQVCAGGNHQGIAAQMSAYRYWELENLVTQALTGYRPVLVVAEGLEDPQNLGSLIRSCEAMGVSGLIIPQRRAVGVTMTVAKVSAGALEHLPISRVVNLRQALERLKEAGFWIVGTDAQADKDIYEIDLTGPTVLVIGSEQKGLSLMIQKCCDLITSIPLLGKTPSLNAAVAGAVVIYELLRQRQALRLRLEQ